MKKQFVLAVGVLGLLVFSGRASGEIFTVILCNQTNSGYPAETNIQVQADSVVEWGAKGVSTFEVLAPDSPGSTNFTRVGSYWGAVGYDWYLGTSIRSVVGPAAIKVEVHGDDSTTNYGFCTVKITKQAGTFTPSTAVVIPSDAQGPVDILLESSTNLVQWTQALPGTYGTSSQLRYFRVRAVQK